MKFACAGHRTLTGTLGVTLPVGTAGATIGATSAAATTAVWVTAAAPAHLSWPTVTFGDAGNRGFAIQYLLRARGYAVGPSGVFWGITRHDVRTSSVCAG